MLQFAFKNIDVKQLKNGANFKCEFNILDELRLPFISHELSIHPKMFTRSQSNAQDYQMKMTFSTSHF